MNPFAAQTLTDAGFVVLGVITIVDRLEGAKEALHNASLPLVSLLTRNDFPA